MTPEQSYQNAINQLGFMPDKRQAEAVQLTQNLYLKLIKQQQIVLSDNFLQRISQAIRQKLPFSNPAQSIKGLYFWGGVGQGKTWLIDSFFNTLPFNRKRRIHFHHLMQEVHEQLKILPKTPDPLRIVAKQLAQQYDIMCIDEFHVQDITDAMLLAGLLKALYAHGVILVTTANTAPDELYKNGLQRERFLPAIDLLKQNSKVFELNSNTDYRSLLFEKEGYYHTPLNEHNADMMLQHFISISNHAPIDSIAIEINQRPIQTIASYHPEDKYPESVIWFEFNDICNTARSSSDYLLIAKRYTHILIANIYSMDEQKDDVAKRFMHLIDALYDNHCFLVISASAEPEDLYHGRKLKMSFQRTASRLKEMRSKLYRGKLRAMPNKCADDDIELINSV